MSEVSAVGEFVNDADSTSWPDLDVVMPIRNEAAHLEIAIAAVRAQDYPGRVRILIGLGPSDDGSEAVARDLAADCDDVVVVENPSGRTPSALNAAIRAGSAPVIARVDGHSQLPGGYLRLAVTTMQRTGAVNVGGRQIPIAATPFEGAVASATTSLLGTGGASYRVGGIAGPVDTVYLGVFDRSAIESVGLFDERLTRNQDYELNIRLRKAGGTVWFDPALWVGYRPRGSRRALAEQYYQYGFWKAAVMGMHPDAVRGRQVLVPVAIAAVSLASLASVRYRPMATVPLAYAAALLLAPPAPEFRTARVPRALALATIHFSWAIGAIRGSAAIFRSGPPDRETARR